MTTPTAKAMEAAIGVRENYCAHTVVVVGDDDGCHKCRKDELTRDIARALDAFAAAAVADERDETAKKFPRSTFTAGGADSHTGIRMGGYNMARAEIREWLRKRARKDVTP